MGLSCTLYCWCLHTESQCWVCISPFYSRLAWNPLNNVYRLWKWMAFRFNVVLCSVSASCFGVMTITVKRKCICASPLSSSCLFLWPFEIDAAYSTLHFAAQCTWWWWWWWWCIYSEGCDWTNTFRQCLTITWFYCLIFMSLKLSQSLLLCPSFFFLSTLFSLHHSTTPSPFICSLYIKSLSLSFPLHVTLSTPLSPPTPPLYFSFSAVLIVTQLSGCQF